MKKSERAVLQLTSVNPHDGGARVDWTLLEGKSKYLAYVCFEVTYTWGPGGLLDFNADRQPALKKCVSFAFLSIALPLLLLEHKAVHVETPFSWTDADMAYWRNAMRCLGFDIGRLKIRGGREDWELGSPAGADRIGLFYGGGIESNASLSALVDRKPLLFVVEGPLWMNNNTDANVGIKRDLEQRLCKRFGLEMVYARTDARWLISAADTLMNYYCTGGLFYWLAAAAAVPTGVGQFYIAQELEYTLIRDRFDMSLTPERLFWSWHTGGPMLVPILGWAASIELLDRLKDTEFIDYVYSCFHNTGKRWCGKCTKCYRVSEWSRCLGIPPERLGLETPVSGTREGAQLYRLHWHCADHLYPKPTGAKALPWTLPVTDLDLIDLCRIGLFEIGRGSPEWSENQLVIAPEESSGEGEVHFDGLALRGHDLFACKVLSTSDAGWRLSIVVKDTVGNTITERSLEVQGSGIRNWREPLPELFGAYNITIQAARSNPKQELGPAPAWVLPVFSRATVPS